MVGSWPLAPHCDHLQYIYHVHLMQRGQNRGVTKYIIYQYESMINMHIIFDNLQI